MAQTIEQSSQRGAIGLRDRRLELESDLNRKREGGAADDDPELRNLQLQLLQVASDEDSQESLVIHAEKGLGTSFASVPVLYVTNRLQQREGEFTSAIGAGTMKFGVASTKIPVDYGVRSDLFPRVERPVTLIGTPLPQPIADVEGLTKKIGQDLKDGSGRKRRVLLFVHGYNVDFATAVNAAARIATEVQFPVIPMTLDWASAGNLIDYWKDEENVRISTVDFTAFLQNFLNGSPAEVDIVCHSMGARLVTTALSELARRGEPLPSLRKVIFGAGDISQAEFARQWPALRQLTGVQFTFYMSDQDRALWASHVVHQFPRLGDAKVPILLPEGGVSIDSSNIRFGYFDLLGHSYLYSNPRVGADIGSWIDGQQSPQQRGLESLSSNGLTFYAFP